MGDSDVEDWAEVEGLFHGLLDLPEGEREAVLCARTEGNPGLRDRVRRLLESHGSASLGFLEPTGAGRLGQDGSGGIPTGEPIQGRRVGGVSIVERLGQGGMGVVYLAEQEHPRRRVALKLLRSQFDSAASRRRFEFEAEVLARLDHPAIAKVHGAGTEDGLGGSVPYIVMELVEGARHLVDHCDRESLDARRRIELVLRIADAVEHAHRRGVLHRDLKPGNVLVDHHGDPKVIDFGLARRTEDEAASFRTRAGEVLGTLAYMSPEQAGGDPEAIDVRSDVYALGGILYRLLTGQPPHGVAELPLTEALRVVRDSRIRPPSDWNPELAGDLESVMLGALEGDLDERYATVHAFRSDLRRYLDSQPIERVPPGPWRRARLYVRRNRRSVAVAALLAGSLLLASAVSLEFGLEARESARQELRAAEHAEKVGRFLERIFQSAAPLSSFGQEVTVLAVLEEARSLLEEGGEEQDPALEAEVRAVLGGVYFALGQFDVAEEQYRRMEALWARTEPSRPEFAARKRVRFGAFLLELNALEEGTELIRDGRNALVEILGPEHEDSLVADVAWAEALSEQGSFEAAIEKLRTTVGALTRTLGPDHLETLDGRIALGRILVKVSRLEEARAELQEVADRWTELRGPDYPMALVARRNLTEVLQALGRPDEAAEHLVDLQDAIEGTWGRQHPNFLSTRFQLGLARLAQGRIDEAEAIFEGVLVEGEPIEPIRPIVQSLCWTGLGRVHLLRGDLADAERCLGEAHGAHAEAYGPQDFRTFRSEVVYAGSMADPVESEARLRSAGERLREQLGEDHEMSLGATVHLAERVLGGGRAEEAEALARRVLEGRRATLGGDHPETLRAEVLLCRALLDQGENEEALARMGEVLDRARRVWPPDHLARSEPEAVLARALASTEAQGARAEMPAPGALFDSSYRRIREAFGPRNPLALRISGWALEHHRAGGDPEVLERWERRASGE